MARQKQFKTILVTGTKSDKWPTLRDVQKAIKVHTSALAEDSKETIWSGYVITGASRPVEKLVVSASKILKFRTLVAPANFQLLQGNTAEQLRNADIIDTFKPEKVIVFVDKTEADDTVVSHLRKIADRKHIDVAIYRKK